MRRPLTVVQPGEARAILILWAAWSLLVPLLASTAMALPVQNSSPWTAVFHAPPLARWDSSWYHNIAVNGYRFDPTQPENNVGFYPLYPLTVRALSAVLHAPLLATGIVLSLVCLGAALLLMGDLFVEWGGEGAGLAGAAALLAFPTAFFLAAFYTESMFLLLAVAALWGARRGHWLFAGAAAAGASLTRFNGFVLVAALGAYALFSLRSPERGRSPRAWIALAIASAGAAAYPLYLWRRFGDPLLYVHSKMAGWPVKPAPPWTLVADVVTRLRTLPPAGKAGPAIELACAALFLVLTVALFRRGLVAEGVFTAGTLLLLLTSGSMAGIQRYVLILFPCYLPLAVWLRRRPALAIAYAFAGIGSGVVLLHRFVHWLFVG